MNIDNKYKEIISEILINGYEYQDPNRKGVLRKEIPFCTLTHKITEGLPLIKIRKTFWKGAVSEMLLFMKGKTDIRDFWEYGIRFWDGDYARWQGLSEETLKGKYEYWKKDPKERGWSTSHWLGAIYGHQYQKQHSIFDKFKKDPLITDLIVNSWQVDDLSKMSLYPCHYSFQLVGVKGGFYVSWNQRSTDVLLGLPINVMFYYLIGSLLEKWSGHKFLGVCGNLTKLHLYDNQIEIAKEIEELDSDYISHPRLELNIEADTNLSFEEFIKEIEPDNFKVTGYKYLSEKTTKMLTYKRK